MFSAWANCAEANPQAILATHERYLAVVLKIHPPAGFSGSSAFIAPSGLSLAVE